MMTSDFQYVHVRLHGSYKPTSLFREEPKELMAQGGFTLAYRFPKSDVIQVGYSYCSLEDNFNRKIGVQIATGRALKGKGFSLQDIAPGTADFADQTVADKISSMPEPKIGEDEQGNFYLSNRRESSLETYLLVIGYQSWLYLCAQDGNAMECALKGIRYSFNLWDIPKIEHVRVKPLDFALESIILL